mgnify:CR=1 FL=1
MNVIGQNGNDGEHYDRVKKDEIEVDPTLTLTRRDGKTMNLKDYINKFTKNQDDGETKTY